MQFKEGSGWRACYDEKTGIYTAERKGCGYHDLYEITEEIFKGLVDGMSDAAVEIFESEKNNREQRRKKREKRESNKDSEGESR